MSNELLPCPYCGSKAEVYSFYGANSDKILYTPRCIDVGCLAHRSTQTYASKVEAITAWNRRFVCLDKNGDKVFLHDRVRYQPKNWKTRYRDCDVLAHRPPRYGYGLAGEDDWWTSTFYSEDIELIKKDT